MKIFAVGLNHKTAPIEVRDEVTIGASDLGRALDILRKNSYLKESFILSTCNRTEIYGLMYKAYLDENRLTSLYRSLYKDPANSLDEYLYFHTAEEAARHLFLVSTGLDSLALGEPQIFGQVKEAYRIASERGNTGPILNRLFHKGFEVTKNIRTNTKIGEGTTSIGFAAVEMAQKIFGDLSPLKVMVVGAGETGTLTANHFHKRGVTRFLIANRTFEKGEKLASSLQGSAIRFDKINMFMSEIDIIVTCVGAEDMIITPEPVKQAMKARKNRPLFLIDLGAPRDIDPGTRDIYNVFAFDIDDLKDVVDSNLARRKHEEVTAGKIIEHEVKAFFDWYATIGILPTIKKLQKYFEKIRRSEIETHKNKFNGNNFEQIDLLTKGIIKKILTDPILRLKKKANTEEGIAEAEALMKIFNLEETPPKNKSQ